MYEASNTQTGRVYIVGAGPGDPDLLTVKALRLITQADVVVYDRLVSPQVLDLVPTGTARIYVGKAAGRHALPQPEINQLLVQLGRSGRTVVRLKGGDPYIFGRGSEEALALAEHGIAFDVVPGISAAAGCTAYAGIPLTHRGLAHGLRFVTGHVRDDGELDLDWDKLADPDATLAIYMGLGNVGLLVTRLVAAGLPAATPAAAIERGTTPAQRVVITTLGELPQAVVGLEAPTMLVIGKTVALAAKLAPAMECYPAAAAERKAAHV
jgi:uroporphyrin-III C-methyltransferase/precorrin-2 dehydrogenase/sirohydrochlorin ferrochelatase/uroporphyrin-III C-methyltransferase